MFYVSFPELHLSDSGNQQRLIWVFGVIDVWHVAVGERGFFIDETGRKILSNSTGMTE